MPLPAPLPVLFSCCLCLSFPVLSITPNAAELPRFVESLHQPEAGALLVADTSMMDPRFRQSVVLIVEHSRLGGTLGLIINRRTDTDLATLVPEFSGPDGRERAIYLGGPIAGGGLVYLARQQEWQDGGQQVGPLDGDTAGQRVIDGIVLGRQESQLLELLDAGIGDQGLRVYVGFCRWGPQQLMDEIHAGAWALRSADAATVFADVPEDLWYRLQQAVTGGGLVVQAQPHGEG